MSEATGRYAKRLRDLAGVFSDAAAFAERVARDGDALVYEVYEHRAEERPGDLIFGTSVLRPGTVGGEYHMTRGHIHRVADRTEMYHCVSGRGVLVMESLDGTAEAIEMTPGSVAYVPPERIHRSVNVGDEPFVTVFCYPADAGQDYDVVRASAGMRLLVVDDGSGGWSTIDNPHYVLRSH